MNPAVLAVDDSSDDLLLLQRAHLRAGAAFSLVTASDGAEAIEYLGGCVASSAAGRRAPELMLLDLKMPGKDGFEVLAWLQSQQPKRICQVAVFTSSSNGRDVAAAYAAGADWYIVKPVDQDDRVRLVHAIDRYLLNGTPITDSGVHVLPRP